MANIFIRDTGDEVSAVSFPTTPSIIGTANEDPLAFASYGSISISLSLRRSELFSKNSNIYVGFQWIVSSTPVIDETVFLVNSENIIKDDTFRWYTAVLNNGPYDLSNVLGSFKLYGYRVLNPTASSVKIGHDNGAVLNWWMRVTGTPGAPNKPINPTPSDALTGVKLSPNLIWEAG